MPETKEQIVAYINDKATRHRAAADKQVDPAKGSYHRGTAVILEALAGEISADFHLAS